MSAIDLLKSLLKVGVSIKDIVSKAYANGAIDWPKVLSAVAGDATLGAELNQVIAALKPSEVKKSIDEIDKKQQALLHGRPVAALGHDELMQYADLADARLLLATQQLTAALSENTLQWLVDDALPTLIKILPAVLPLLL